VTRTSLLNTPPPDPVTVERALRVAYLDITPDDRSPLVCVDATAERLSPVLDGFAESGTSHATVLARACGDPDAALSIFAGRSEHQPWADSDTPGVLRHLVLACVLLARPADTDQGADDDTTRNFRINLGRAFGRENAPSIRGLPGLWKRLARWSEKRHVAHGDARRVMPSGNEPVRGGTHRWPHLGTTYRMTLPSWRDAARFERLLIRHPVLLDDAGPRELALALPTILAERMEFSDAFLLAARSFVDLHERRAGLLGYHRFWHVFETIAGRVASGRDSPTGETRQRVRLLLGEEIRIELSSGASGVFESLSPDHALALLRSRSQKAGPGVFSRNLRAMVETGAVVFHPAGLAVGEVEPLDETPEGAPAWVLLDESGRARAAERGLVCRGAGPGWWLTEPLDPYATADLVAALGVDVVGPERVRDARVRLDDGVRVSGSTWLGFAEFLPAVRTGLGASVRIEPSDAELVRDTSTDVGDRWRLRADVTLEGVRIVTVEERDELGPGALVASTEIAFVREAPPHPRLGEPTKDGRWDLEDGTHVETAPRPNRSAKAADVVGTSPGENEDDAISRLLEAMYAAGRAGWREQALLALISRSPAATGRSGFGILAAFEEAGWLRSARVVGWRARRWWLLPPSLGPAGDVAGRSVLRGATSRAIRRRFRRTVDALGGRVLRVGRGAVLCPPLLVAVEVDRHALASETGWPLDPFAPGPIDVAPRCWIASRDDGTTHVVVATWNWERARFEFGTRAGDVAGTTVERLRRERGDRHDLYRVRHGTEGAPCLLTPDRPVALTEAYRLAGVPFLERCGDRLLARSDDARLPLSIARHVRDLHPLGVSGPVDVDGSARYAYPWNEAVGCALVRTYGRRFLGGTDAGPSRPDTRRVDSVRRVLARRGRRVNEGTLVELAAASTPRPSGRS